MDALAALALQIEWGADEALAEHALDRRVAQGAPPAALPVTTAPAETVATAAPPAVPAMAPLARAQALAAAAPDLAALRAALAGFDGCALRTTATNLVFGDGDPASPVVLVADVPGAAEDRTGTPFAGPAGLFLDRMLASIGLDRAGLYATSLLPWRPPGDRKPADTEIQLCLPFLWRHLALLQPRQVVVLGAMAGRTLLPATGRRARGWHRLTVPGLAAPVPALALGSPAHIQATPTAKRDAWADLLRLRRALDGTDSSTTHS
jgi:uracil-DNA glycosylase